MARQWFIWDGNEKKGPFPWQELCRQARSGGLRREQLVWTEGLAAWTPGRDIQGLFAAPPPPPAPSPQATPPPPPPYAPPAPTSPVPVAPALSAAETPSSATRPASGQIQRTVSPANLAPPLRVRQYLGFYAAFLIPPLGVLLMLIWAVNPKCNPNLRNLSRAMIIVSILSLAVFWILLYYGFYPAF